MFSGLRRVRSAAGEDGNLKRYFSYAIGEILLVMVGILLAVQVNNWNEARKLRAIEYQALKDLNQEFVANGALFAETVARKELALKINQELIAMLVDQSGGLSELIRSRVQLGDGGVSTFNPSNGVLNSLSSSGRINQIENDSLKYLLTSWRDILLDYQEEEKNHLYYRHNHWEPYELSLIPRPYVRRGKREWAGQNVAATQKAFSEAFADRRYINFLIRNEAYLFAAVTEARTVENQLQQVLRLLEQEIASRD